MKQAIVIGASSGIGRELAKVLSADEYDVGLVARRVELLSELADELPGRAFVKQLDISQPDTAMPLLRQLVAEMGDVELIVINAGIGEFNKKLTWELEQATIDTNVTGFAAAANVAVEHFETRGSGHIVGISSISALRGSGHAPAYNASKAFVSNYLQGLKHRFAKRKRPIIVTDVQPGFVKTPMAKGVDRFWEASAEEAARQIHAAIRGRKSHVYVTKRWRLIAWILRLAPDWLYHRM